MNTENAEREIRAHFEHGSGLFILVEYDRARSTMRDTKGGWFLEASAIAAAALQLEAVEWGGWRPMAFRAILPGVSTAATGGTDPTAGIKPGERQEIRDASNMDPEAQAARVEARRIELTPSEER